MDQIDSPRNQRGLPVPKWLRQFFVLGEEAKLFVEAPIQADDCQSRLVFDVLAKARDRVRPPTAAAGFRDQSLGLPQSAHMTRKDRAQHGDGTKSQPQFRQCEFRRNSPERDDGHGHHQMRKRIHHNEMVQTDSAREQEYTQRDEREAQNHEPGHTRFPSLDSGRGLREPREKPLRPGPPGRRGSRRWRRLRTSGRTFRRTRSVE